MLRSLVRLAADTSAQGKAGAPVGISVGESELNSAESVGAKVAKSVGALLTVATVKG